MIYLILPCRISHVFKTDRFDFRLGEESCHTKEIEIGIMAGGTYVLIAEVVKALKEHTVRKKPEEAFREDEIRGTLNPIKWLS